MGISTKVASRISTELKKYLAILKHARERDVSEADTVTIIGDMLSDVMGYDKYQHVSTEHAIKGTYVDLAVTVENKTRFLIEAKAAGTDLKENHVKQVVDYAANEGVEWVVLTNGSTWRVYNVQFTKPIDRILVCEVDVLNADRKSDEILECFGNLSFECFSKDAMEDLLQHKQFTGKFVVATVLMSDAVIDKLRRELRRLSTVNVDCDYLLSLMTSEIIKRELVDGDEANAAQAIVRRLQRAQDRERKKADAVANPETVDSELSTPPTSTTAAS